MKTLRDRVQTFQGNGETEILQTFTFSEHMSLMR